MALRRKLTFVIKWQAWPGTVSQVIVIKEELKECA
jgi:hypothetical protein